AFGELVEAHYEFGKAAVILSLDCDFLYTHPDRLRYTRQFAEGRRVVAGRKEMNRLYVVESTPTVTGEMAEHRLPLSSAEIETFAWQLAHELSGARQTEPKQTQNVVSSSVPTKWLTSLIQDLKQHQGASIVIAGEWQPPIVHALAHWL